MSDNTLLLRLAGPMQAWGSGSRFQLRRTESVPGKSGVIGLILCAMGIRREEASAKAAELSALKMAVRVDRAGHTDWDYQTVGAGIGIRQAEGGVKKTATTGEPETLLSRRQYLWDASFTVALQGPGNLVADAAQALSEPVWPPFLGRKCCVPTEPVFLAAGRFANLAEALGAIEWTDQHGSSRNGTTELQAFIEHDEGGPVPPGAFVVYDTPRTLRNPSHGPRLVVPGAIKVRVATVQPANAIGRRRVNYAAAQWRAVRESRLELDRFLCVFCKMPAEDVHHVTYERAGNESLDDLRSLCKICHDACTQLEYGSGMTRERIDPAEPAARNAIMEQVGKLLSQRRLARRQAIRDLARGDFFNNVPDAGIS